MNRSPVALLLVAAFSPAGPAVAHHSFAAYDSDRTLTLSGTVETFEWANPHVRLQILGSADRMTLRGPPGRRA